MKRRIAVESLLRYVSGIGICRYFVPSEAMVVFSTLVRSLP